MEPYTVLRIDEAMYGCEELPENAEIQCEVLLQAPDGTRKRVFVADKWLTEHGIREDDRVLLHENLLLPI